MMSRLRVLAPLARTSAVAPRVKVPTRNMSGGHDPVQAYADMNSWVQYSIGMAGVCVAVTGWVVYLESSHEHSHHVDERAYKKIRSKPYPWSCSDCNLFNSECFKKCKEGK